MWVSSISLVNLNIYIYRTEIYGHTHTRSIIDVGILYLSSKFEYIYIGQKSMDTHTHTRSINRQTHTET